MILQALYELAEHENLVPDPDFELKPISWVVEVNEQGRGLRTLKDWRTSTEAKKGAKVRRTGKFQFVPREAARTSGDRAFFLFDKAEYALGLDPTGSRPAAKLASRAALFLERVQGCADATGDPGAQAIATFLSDLATGRQQITLPSDCASNDLIAFLYSPVPDELVTARQAVREYWKGLCREAETNLPIRRCLVTGEFAPVAEKHMPLKFVPGGSTSGVAMVSFNSAAFESYGWKRNDNADVSQRAAVLCGEALQRLLHPNPPKPTAPHETLPHRNLFLGGKTVACYWSPDSSDFPDAYGGLNATNPNPEQVREMYRSIWRGRPAPIGEGQAGAFYVLVLSGAQGRAVLHSCFRTTITEANRHLARYFGELRIDRITPPPKKGSLPPAISYRTLLDSLLASGESQGDRSRQASLLLRCALTNTPFPRAFLQRAIARTIAEIRLDGWRDLDRFDARSALIKAFLNRDLRLHPQSVDRREVLTHMDLHNREPGYVFGRLMALYERIQKEALGEGVNASVVDLYFGTAARSPQRIFARLEIKARNHLRKLRTGNEKERVRAKWLSKELEDLFSLLKPGQETFPQRLPLDQQGLFILGYHHQRRWFFTKAEERQRIEESPAATTH